MSVKSNPDSKGLPIPAAAETLGLSALALKARVKRAKKEEAPEGTRADLGHGVTALKPIFHKEWLIFIPPEVVKAVSHRRAAR